MRVSTREAAPTPMVAGRSNRRPGLHLPTAPGARAAERGGLRQRRTRASSPPTRPQGVGARRRWQPRGPRPRRGVREPARNPGGAQGWNATPPTTDKHEPRGEREERGRIPSGITESDAGKSGNTTTGGLRFIPSVSAGNQRRDNRHLPYRIHGKQARLVHRITGLQSRSWATWKQ